MSSLLSRYDVVIIGGGVSGCSTAYFLAASVDFDGSVLVIERDPTYINAPSANAAGGIRQQFSTPENIEIGLFGAHFVKNIDRYLSINGEVPDVGFRERGYLILATAEMMPVMRENHTIQQRYDTDIVFRDPAALAQHHPWLNTTNLAGGFFGQQNEGWLDPYSLLQAFRRKARALGVTFAHDEVLNVHYEGRRATEVILKNGSVISAGTVVNAAGARDVAAIAQQLGIELPVEPRKRCSYSFSCPEDIGTTPHTIFPNGIAVRKETSGYYVTGAPPPGWNDPATHDSDVDYALFDEHIWPSLADYIPAFEALKLTNAACCHYDFNTLDENVIIGLTPDYDNFYLIAGFSGHGLQQSPAIGRAMNELIVYGEYRTLDLSRFGYERILTGAPLRETNCY